MSVQIFLHGKLLGIEPFLFGSGERAEVLLGRSRWVTLLTEVLRLTKQRVGQDLFRGALMDYWSGACAVTGIAVPELLRASHAKPWADCATDAERLNVFNGFLLCAHLDALFDRGFLTFSDEGLGQLSPQITPAVRAALNLTEEFRLRWCSPKHAAFLQYHRQQVVQL